MTIQSVQLNSNKSYKNDSDLSLVESNMVDSLNVNSKHFGQSAKKEEKEPKVGKNTQRMAEF